MPPLDARDPDIVRARQLADAAVLSAGRMPDGLVLLNGWITPQTLRRHGARAGRARRVCDMIDGTLWQ